MTPLPPPHDLDTERVVLAAALMSTEGLDDAKSVIEDPEIFWLDAHQVIWRTMLELDDEGAPVEVTSVAQRLRAEGSLDRVGGTPELGRLIAETPAVANVEYHARALVDLHVSRTVIQHCQRYAVEGRQQTNPRKWAAEAADEIHDTIPEDQDGDEGEIRALITSICEDIDARRNGQETKRAIPTGFRDLDQALGGGWYRGNLYIAAARPGMGKTALGVCAAHNCASAKRAAPFLGLEMPPDQVATRQLSMVSGVPGVRLQGGRLSIDEYKLVTEAAPKVARLPISYDDCSGLTVGGLRTKLRRRLRKLRAIHGEQLELGLVVIDYIQKIKTKYKQGRSRDNELGEVSEGCRLLAKEFDAPVLLLAQLNREVEKRPNKRPQLSDLRESGSLEQDAYAVLMLYRDDYYDDESKEPGVTEVIIAKHRNGATGTVKLGWQAQTTSFYDMNDSPFDGYEFGPLEYEDHWSESAP